MLGQHFNICCPRDCFSRHNGGTSGAPLKPLRVDSALSIPESLCNEKKDHQYQNALDNI